jgi:hypothetical protein
VQFSVMALAEAVPVQVALAALLLRVKVPSL